MIILYLAGKRKHTLRSCCRDEAGHLLCWSLLSKRHTEPLPSFGDQILTLVKAKSRLYVHLRGGVVRVLGVDSVDGVIRLVPVASLPCGHLTFMRMSPAVQHDGKTVAVIPSRAGESLLELVDLESGQTLVDRIGVDGTGTFYRLL